MRKKFNAKTAAMVNIIDYLDISDQNKINK